MRLLGIYIENFMCYSISRIDFTEFSSALIIGKKNNNELFSNGVGKTTIFKGIEYVLFNQADFNLEKIIREDTDFCKISLDFIVDDIMYRLMRTRTKKGVTDLSLFERTPTEGTKEDLNDIKSDAKFWKDISGRRTSDTEKDVAKLIKINFKSFRNTVHFMQNDFTGLTTATPEKRKGILKEALNLAIYSKLEKLAKEKSSALSKEIDKNRLHIEHIGDVEKDLSDLLIKKNQSELLIHAKKSQVTAAKNNIEPLTDQLHKLTNEHSVLQSKFSSLVSKEKSLSAEKSKCENSVKEYSTKKSSITKIAKDLIEELKFLKEDQEKLKLIDLSTLEIDTSLLSDKKDKIAQLNLTIQNNSAKYEELKIPMPGDGQCKHCRQELTKEHRELCLLQIKEEMESCQNTIKNCKTEIAALTKESQELQVLINSINSTKSKLDKLEHVIESKSKEVQDKRSTYKEYSDLLQKFTNDLQEKSTELDSLKIELENSSIAEANEILKKINSQKELIRSANTNLSNENSQLNTLTNSLAVIENSIEEKNKNIIKKNNVASNLLLLEEKYKVYPSVLQAFSSAGIPNLIIQNVLDDLQIEANQLLAQINPELQLAFAIEKTKSDGTQDETLDVIYFVNGKEQYFEQMSGAMKFSITFSLKLGLSFLLQKMMGVNINFLMLDEIDQSLDKGSSDYLSDIIKFFQTNFTILVITHNDRLKDKFQSHILVEQDINRVSNARLMTYGNL